MADQRLNIIFSGDASQLTKTLDELESDLRGFREQLKGNLGVDEFNRLNKAIASTEAQMKAIRSSGTQFSKTLSTATTAIKNISPASNAATTSLINLGRVVQDAPFGIIGIANNINPLLESFQRLRASSASTGAALKAFGASLIGGGGIGLGVSIVTSLLTQFALSNRGAKEENDKFSEAVQRNTDAIKAKQDEFANALNKAAQSIINQSAKLSDLNTILSTTSQKIDDVTQSTIRLGLGQFLFDKKNLELQKLLTAEITKQLKAREFTKGKIDSFVPEFDPGFISKNPLDRQIAQSKANIGQINNLAEGLEDIFKKLASSLNGSGDDIAKQQDKIIARARQFVKEFGGTFVLPDLEDSFFKTKAELFKQSLDLLSDVKNFIEGQSNALKIKIPITFEESQISETVTKDIQSLNKVIQSLKPVTIDITSKGISEVKKEIDSIKDKTVTISLKQLGQVSLDDLKDKEISISIKQEGDVKKIAEQLTKLKGVDVPIVIEKKGDVSEIIKELSKLKGVDIPIKITKEGDIKEIVSELGKLKGVDINVSAKGVDLVAKQLASLRGTDVVIDVTTKGIEEVKKDLSKLEDKTITVSLKQLGEISLDDLKDKEISVAINQKGDVKQIVEQLSKLKGVEVPIIIEKQGDVKEIVKELSSLKGVNIPIKINQEGDIEEIVKELSGLKGVQINVSAKGIDDILKNLSSIKGKEIELKISQQGDVKKIAEQLTQLKGVDIPIVIEQKGNVDKIAEELTKLKGKTIPIKIVEKGKIQEIVTQLKGLKDVQVNISATENVDEALKNIETLIKDKPFPIIINQDGIITQISKAVDGAIKIVQTKKIIIPVFAELQGPAEQPEGVRKEIEDGFKSDIERGMDIPVDVKFDPSLSKESISLIDKKLDLRKQFSRFGKTGIKEFNKIFDGINFKSAFDKKSVDDMNKGLEKGAKQLQLMNDLAATLAQSLSQGLANAFNNVFDAILEGKSVFKALGESVKQLVVQTAKAVVQMIILKAMQAYCSYTHLTLRRR